MGATIVALSRRSQYLCQPTGLVTQRERSEQWLRRLRQSLRAKRNGDGGERLRREILHVVRNDGWLIGKTWPLTCAGLGNSVWPLLP